MKRDWGKYNQELVNRGAMLAMYMIMPNILIDIIDNVNANLKHDETVAQIERVFRKYRFYTTREYPIFKMKDGSDRAGRIDLVARRGKFRVAIEYDHKYSVKYKSFQKVTQIMPEVAVVIAGFGDLKPNIQRADKYARSVRFPFYIVSLKEENFGVLNEVKGWEDIKNEWQATIENID